MILQNPVPTRWSVSLRTEGDRVVEREEVVALADAISVFCGIACGVGQTGYGAQFVVVASSRTEALLIGLGVFDRAVSSAGLPAFPISYADATSEAAEAGLRPAARNSS
jgi:hypothetical protein